MPDTIRTIAELQTLLADNAGGAISAQDLRDMLVSLANAWQVHSTNGWKDTSSDLLSARTGPSAPTLTTFGPSGNLQALAFAKGDQTYFEITMPHDVAPGTLMYPYVHWSTNGTDTGPVIWELEYSIASGHNQESFPASTQIVISEAGAGTPWRHMTTAGSGVAVPEPNSMIYSRLQRSNDAGDTNLDTVYALSVDWHYESDRLSTKNRVPDFYT